MAKQYQSIGGGVNEPSDVQREYQTTQAVVQTQAIPPPPGGATWPGWQSAAGWY